MTPMKRQAPCDDVPLTKRLLCLVKLTQSVRQMNLDKSALAGGDGDGHGEGWFEATRQFFFSQREHADACGIALNEITFEAIIARPIPEECLHTDFEELPKKFVFNPWKGGILRITPSGLKAPPVYSRRCVSVTAGISEEEQEGRFANATRQSAKDALAFSVATTVEVPEYIGGDQEQIASFLRRTLTQAAVAASGAVSFKVQLGPARS